MHRPILPSLVTSLPVMEQFYTIQGEGYHQGKAAFFIRLAGCDVGCIWCDVKESWDASQYHSEGIEQLVAASRQYPSDICVITGGEPLLYDLSNLTTSLHQVNKKTHLETSGVYPLTGSWDWICVSPKKFKAPLPEILPLAHELKVIIYSVSDFRWAESYSNKVADDCRRFLQPEWSKEKTILPHIADYVKEHPKWSISLQIHKYMNIP